jgi:hypothetical protein
MPWVRSGYCCRCGQCCVGDPFSDVDRPRRAVMPGYCPLYEVREGVGFCAGHVGVVKAGEENSYYLNACATWPDHPSLIIDKPACTYKFDWAD